jgi:hypothetical protein
MKLYNFPEIFGEYIATEKYRSMLSNTLFTDLHINKEEGSMSALLHVDAFQNIMCLKAVANEIKYALKLKSVEFEYVLPPEALKTECFPMLLKVVKKSIPQTNGFLDEIDTEFENDVFTINFLKHGRDICQNAGADKFLEEYHIQGKTNSTIYLGAFYENELVAVMLFLKEKQNNWNLNRFATSDKYYIYGISGKMFKYFKENYVYNVIKSFADRRWTNNMHDNLYTKLGFQLTKILPPDYRYFNSKVDRYKRFHKFLFRKQILHKKYNLPLNMTESEMTEKLGYTKIYDCGLLKYEYKKETLN